MTSRVVLGVGGGIAAYKACELLRRLKASGHDVRVVPTASALEFVGRATWEALSGHPVSETVFSDVHEVPHVAIGQGADLVVIAPATANLLARAAHGLADDLLGNVLLTARCPVIFAPAMHTEMWEHPATVDNVATLRSRGCVVIEPAVGRLTGADSGPGRLPEPEQLAAVVESALLHTSTASGDLAGKRVVISAGGTREAIDPVRFIGNRSSGKQGYAIARAAIARGAQVTLLSANVDLVDPAGATVLRVTSAAELHKAAMELLPESDVFVMAAAVADFRPASPGSHKIKKSGSGVPPMIELLENADVLKDLVQQRGAQRLPLLVGFAAETGDEHGSVLEHGQRKLASKGCDLLVVNDVSGDAVFGQDVNEVVMLSARDTMSAVRVPSTTKDQIAHEILNSVLAEISA